MSFLVVITDIGQALCKLLEAQVQALPKGLEAKVQPHVLYKGLKAQT